MTTQERDELRDWIHVNVFGWTPCKEAAYPQRKAFEKDGEIMIHGDHPDYPTDPAAALLVLEKCLTRFTGSIQIWDSSVSVVKTYKVGALDFDVTAETLPLALCQFAKKLYSK